MRKGGRRSLRCVALECLGAGCGFWLRNDSPRLAQMCRLRALRRFHPAGAALAPHVCEVASPGRTGAEQDLSGHFQGSDAGAPRVGGVGGWLSNGSVSLPQTGSQALETHDLSREGCICARSQVVTTLWCASRIKCLFCYPRRCSFSASATPGGRGSASPSAPGVKTGSTSTAS